jgi:hypothetical protein
MTGTGKLRCDTGGLPCYVDVQDILDSRGNILIPDHILVDDCNFNMLDHQPSSVQCEVGHQPSIAAGEPDYLEEHEVPEKVEPECHAAQGFYAV